MIITNISKFTKEQMQEISWICKTDIYFVPDFTMKNACKWNDVEVLITYGQNIDSKFLDKCGNLKWIQVFQAGVERIPLLELKSRNIVLTNIVGIHAIPMSEYVLSTILYFSRNIPKYIEDKKSRTWDSVNLVGEVYGKIVGIIGAGTIGQEIAKRLVTLGVKVYGLNTTGELKPNFDKMFSQDQKMDLLEVCDFVILLLPSTNETKNYIDEAELQRMKPTSYLINIGRGPLINEDSFIYAMQNQLIKGAALDVFNEEPLPKESDLWDLDNVLITPHMAANSVNYLQRCIHKFSKNFELYSKNKELSNIIDLDRGY